MFDTLVWVLPSAAAGVVGLLVVGALIRERLNDRDEHRDRQHYKSVPVQVTGSIDRGETIIFSMPDEEELEIQRRFDELVASMHGWGTEFDDISAYQREMHEISLVVGEQADMRSAELLLTLPADSVVTMIRTTQFTTQEYSLVTSGKRH